MVASIDIPWQQAILVATPEPIVFLLLWIGALGVFGLFALRMYDLWRKRDRSRKVWHRRPKGAEPGSDQDLLG